MPTSDPNLIHGVLKVIGEANPRSILDVGIGFGKYGYLAREYLDILKGRIARTTWEVRIDGVEIHEPYLEHWHWLRSIYSHIYVKDIRSFELPIKYNLILLCDVLEHLNSKEEAILLVNSLKKHAKKIVITTPNGYYPQGAFANNPNETHNFGFSDVDLSLAFDPIKIIPLKDVIFCIVRGELT